jgi:SAM-dependent methyltransferase
MEMQNVAFDGQSLITPDLFSKSISMDGRVFDHSQQEFAAQSMKKILDDSHGYFKEGRDPTAIIEETAARLHVLRNSLHKNVWQDVIPMAQDHAVADYFLQDPFTKWSFTKPRGYSGDAGLLDFIYGHPNAEGHISNSTRLGRSLYSYTKEATSSVAVRERRDILKNHVDEIAAERGKGTEILTIAAGHLREANLSHALKEGQIARWVALDQDPQSIASIKHDFAGTCIQPVEGNVRGILADTYKLGQFDFVYAAGLYDYLSDRVAIKLTQACLKMLKPGGTFLFANFAQDIGVDGYMETFMNWPLLLRTEKDMAHIIDSSLKDTQASSRIFYGENRNIVYATIRPMP